MAHIGNDICNPKRIEKIYKRFGTKLLKRILTTQEIEQLQQSKKLFFHRLAGRYAAKEAVAKLLGTGIGKKLSFQDIEVLKDDKSGKPQIKLNAKAQKLAKSLGIESCEVSISHEDIMVMAVAIAN